MFGRPFAQIAALVSVTVATAACQSRTNHVTLSFEGGSGLSGFLCDNNQGTQPLFDRTIPFQKKMNLVVDFLPLAADPGCRTFQIIGYCQQQGGCGASLPLRTCIPGVSVASVTTTSGQSAAAQSEQQLDASMQSQLAGHSLLGSAPSGLVLVRVIGTTEACPTGDSFDPSQLVGCAFSAPVQLDQASGALPLGLDASPFTPCESMVDICAQKFLPPGSPGTLPGLPRP